MYTMISEESIAYWVQVLAAFTPCEYEFCKSHCYAGTDEDTLFRKIDSSV
jgi:hypothetical protein